MADPVIADCYDAAIDVVCPNNVGKPAFVAQHLIPLATVADGFERINDSGNPEFAFALDSVDYDAGVAGGSDYDDIKSAHRGIASPG
jgi:hypothetical protein